jgi:hypothetical protein
MRVRRSLERPDAVVARSGGVAGPQRDGLPDPVGAAVARGFPRDRRRGRGSEKAGRRRDRRPGPWLLRRRGRRRGRQCLRRGRATAPLRRRGRSFDTGELLEGRQVNEGEPPFRSPDAKLPQILREAVLERGNLQATTCEEAYSLGDVIVVNVHLDVEDRVAESVEGIRVGSPASRLPYARLGATCGRTHSSWLRRPCQWGRASGWCSGSSGKSVAGVRSRSPFCSRTRTSESCPARATSTRSWLSDGRSPASTRSPPGASAPFSRRSSTSTATLSGSWATR